MRELTLKQRRKINAMQKTAYALWGELAMHETMYGKVDLPKVSVLIRRLNKHYADFKARDSKCK